MSKHIEEPTVSLRDYFDSKITSLDKATSVASSNMERRLEGMNEFRAQLKDQAALFFTRAEHQAYLEKVDADIRVLRESKATLEVKASQKAVTFSTIVALIGVILAIASLLHSFMEKSAIDTLPPVIKLSK